MFEHFHPTTQAWFRDRLGEPSAPQREGWPLIAAGGNVLIAAPTGSGKTLAAFLHALDGLLRQGDTLPDRAAVLYVSPLRALANDVQKNLLQPLAELRERDPSLPEVRVLVRSGDTPARERQAMTRRPPHVLVTTPESLYLLLTSPRAQTLLASVRTVIVDEIHALARDKRGSHLALSLERLDDLVARDGGVLQRIGLSATQRPLAAMAAFLSGPGRPCAIVDGGHLRELDLAVLLPQAPLEVLCSAATWDEIHAQLRELVLAHRTTLVFVNTRKMAERIAGRLGDQIGKDLVTSHHGSLSKERRLDAEDRLKRGQLRALVATASLELGIDIGDVDLVVQIGPTATIAAFLQRVGRAGHGLARRPKGRIVPLTRDELVAAAALLHAVAARELDRIEIPVAPLDILCQQLVAAAAGRTWAEDELFALVRRAAPFAELSREWFDRALALHAEGRLALLHRDPVGRTVRGTRRALLAAITCGGAIPDVADWRVVLDPDDTLIGTVHEDFAVESTLGDVFQLGNASWQVRGMQPGVLRVVDAHGAPPSLPFWVAEAPARSRELAAHVSLVREHGEDPAWLREHCGLDDGAAAQIATYLREGREALGVVPTQRCVAVERFFDETGGQQLVIHCPFGSRVNRAFGLALRKRFCVGFGFELQAAANEEAIVISLAPVHSFELADVWRYLHPGSVREVLVQAMLPAPMFAARWRWNAQRSLLIERWQGGRRVPAPLLRMRADDALAAAFPQAMACPETLPPGPIEVPEQHPVVAQAVHDCLHEAMDLDGLTALLTAIRDGGVELHARDLSEPSPFAEGVLHAMPYAFLDDAPIEERRTQAVIRGQRGVRSLEPDGELDPAAVAAVAAECRPDPRSAEELHEVLGWIGCLFDAELDDAWRPWLHELLQGGRAERDGDRIFAHGAPRDALAVWRGRCEAFLPMWPDQLEADAVAALTALEAEGVLLRARLQGRELFAHRRLLARVRRQMLERLRRAIQPVSQLDHQRFLRIWQHQEPGSRLEGPHGVATVLERLAGAGFTAEAWEAEVLAQRVDNLRRDWLDQVTLSGQFVWLRLAEPWRGPLSRCGIAIVPRAELTQWLAVHGEHRQPLAPGANAAPILEQLQRRGALFPNELAHHTGLLPHQLEDGLAELIALGAITCDSFAALRQLVVAPSRRRFPVFAIGRFSAVPWPDPAPVDDAAIEFTARSLARRFGVLSQPLLFAEGSPLPWRLLLRCLRNLELRGDLRGGRFVAGWSGEQFALPEAVTALRAAARQLADQEAR